jgi:hypothetical protein
VSECACLTCVHDTLKCTCLCTSCAGRSGYRRCVSQFLHDVEQLSPQLRKLLFKNINSLSAVDIELLHGFFSSVIPKVHRCATEQEAINNACRDTPLLNVVKEQNNHYHKNAKDPGYSMAKQLPTSASVWVDLACTIIRSQ